MKMMIGAGSLGFDMKLNLAAAMKLKNTKSREQNSVAALATPAPFHYDSAALKITNNRKETLQRTNGLDRMCLNRKGGMIDALKVNHNARHPANI